MLLIKSSTIDNKTVQVKVVIGQELRRLKNVGHVRLALRYLKLLFVEQVVNCRHCQRQFLVSMVVMMDRILNTAKNDMWLSFRSRKERKANIGLLQVGRSRLIITIQVTNIAFV